MLLLYNKQDLKQALSIQELTILLQVSLACKETSRPFHVQGTIATTGEGLQEGLAWLCDTMDTL